MDPVHRLVEPGDPPDNHRGRVRGFLRDLPDRPDLLRPYPSVGPVQRRHFPPKGPRKTLPSVSEECEADHLGRRLDHPGYEYLKSAPLVVVSREEDKKQFKVPLGV